MKEIKRKLSRFLTPLLLGEGLGVSFLIVLITTSAYSQNKSPYQVFDKNGKKSSYEKILKAAEKSELVLFGEHHDNSVVHWLQLEFTKDLAEKKSLILGAEMIEADNQKQLNQYLNDEIDQKKFDTTARLWNNYKTDYKPLVDFAKAKKFPFIATNVPRRYASIVFKKDFAGLDDLTDEEKTEVLSALAYFAKPEDLIADHVPVLGFLDDAIMIELVAQELAEDLQAYGEFCQYRQNETERRGAEAHTSKADWLESKRQELQSWMRRRRAEKRSSRSNSGYRTNATAGSGVQRRLFYANDDGLFSRANA